MQRCAFALRRAQPVASPASICLRRAAWLQHRGLCAAVGSIFDAKIPEMGDSISEGTILALMKSPGDYVAAEETVAEIETDKVTVEAKSPHAGTIKEIFVAVDDTVEVGSKFFSLEVGVGEAPAASAAAPAPSAPAAATAAPAAAPAAAPPPPPKAAPAAAAPAASAAVEAPREKRVKMTRMRLKIAQRLKEAQNEAAMLTTFNEVDMSGLTEMRAEYKDAFLKKRGRPLETAAALGGGHCTLPAPAAALEAQGAPLHPGAQPGPLSQPAGGATRPVRTDPD